MRYPLLPIEEMNERQRQVANTIGLSQGELAGPYGALIQSPEIARLVYELDQFLRFNLRIPERLRILSVLVAAGRYKSEDLLPFLALESVGASGLRIEIVEALKAGQRPKELADDEALIYKFVSELAAKGRVRNETFEESAQRFGREVTLEIVKICGFTIFISNLMNVTEHFYPER